MKVLPHATFAMLVQQTSSYLCQSTMPILAADVAADLEVSTSLLGWYLFIVNLAAFFAANSCGELILKYGALRVSQVVLLTMAGSLAVASLGELALMPLAALLLGSASVSTPASSHILSRYCPPRLAPLIFSVKQTGVPIGGLIAGLLVPFLAVTFGVYPAFLATAVIVLAIMLWLQVYRRPFDDDRRPELPFSLGDFRGSIVAVMRAKGLRELGLCAFALGGLQAIFSGFYVAFLKVGLGFDLATAGRSFGIASGVAVGTRILWGLIGGRWIPARTVLAGLSLVGTAAAVALAFCDPSWSFAAATAVAVVYSATAISWHGILLAEISRLSPPGKVGAMTGGVLSFTSLAMMIFPPVFGILIDATGSYGAGFAILAAPALVVAVVLAWPDGSMRRAA